ncbi:hypothetical protein RAC89_29205 [Paenibacillus sp. GD4]|uniref:immunoglobulin-like domain-containing protein n=1 Tax=Paenibacillus sp. GD4 TaxID=3068890 RepID=UPI00279688FB|nr:immunoglobulin-like domain-containing protein [Paenibacillus sp. GD4]MDQ1914460.1 hypothetical protein [Paenibacillus sp. GD4]
MKNFTKHAVSTAILLAAIAVPSVALADKPDHGEKKTGLERALQSGKKSDRAREVLERNLERKLQREHDENDEEKSDAYIVAKDKEELSIDFGGTDTADSVTLPLDGLPAKGEHGSSITWVSSNSAVLSNDGKTLHRPAYGSADAKVTLTATLTYGSATATKTFELTVKSQWTDAQRVAADKEALAITFSGSDSLSSVTGPVTLPATGLHGSSITWLSSNTSVVSNDGRTVVRPAAGSGDATVALTAVITYNGVSETKTFTLTVKQQLTAQQKLAADKEALAITFADSDSLSSVTRPVTLPVTGANGSTITWTSSYPAVLSADGKTVNRPAYGAGDATVVLTATLSNSGLADVKVFTVIVKQQLSDAQKVASDKEALAITYSGTDTASSVTGALTLPAVGVNGSTIMWVSSAPAIISNDGKTVVRPLDGQGDASVTLTAIIVGNGYSDTKTFTVTVKER